MVELLCWSLLPTLQAADYTERRGLARTIFGYLDQQQGLLEQLGLSREADLRAVFEPFAEQRQHRQQFAQGRNKPDCARSNSDA